jgi:hypothetical protein
MLSGTRIDDADSTAVVEAKQALREALQKVCLFKFLYRYTSDGCSLVS